MEDDSEGDSSVQGALDAIEHGTNLLKRIRRSTGISITGYADGVVEAARNLETVLLRNESQIRESYIQNLKEIGPPFIKALSADRTLK